MIELELADKKIIIIPNRMDRVDSDAANKTNEIGAQLSELGLSVGVESMQDFAAPAENRTELLRGLYKRLKDINQKYNKPLFLVYDKATMKAVAECSEAETDYHIVCIYDNKIINKKGTLSGTPRYIIRNSHIYDGVLFRREDLEIIQNEFGKRTNAGVIPTTGEDWATALREICENGRESLQEPPAITKICEYAKNEIGENSCHVKLSIDVDLISDTLEFILLLPWQDGKSFVPLKEKYRFEPVDKRNEGYNYLLEYDVVYPDGFARRDMPLRLELMCGKYSYIYPLPR